MVRHARPPVFANFKAQGAIGFGAAVPHTGSAIARFFGEDEATKGGNMGSMAVCLSMWRDHRTLNQLFKNGQPLQR